MAGPFHVYVDGASAPGRDAILQLAEAMATRFGLPAGELATRIGAGRFRVKANIDRPAADSLAHELQEIGARCSVEDATSARVTPPAGMPQFQSGLSAAFSGQIDATNLGALASDGKPLALASLDGESSRPVRVPSFAPPGSPPPLPPPTARGPQPGKPALPPPRAPVTSESPAAAPATIAVDAFAPPDAAEQELTFELAPDEIARQVRKRLSTPPANEPIAAPLAPVVSRTMSRPGAPAPHASDRGRLGPLADHEVRFAAGVVLAILLGFVPAHMLASMRERSAFAAIDSTVVGIQNRADTQEDFAALDAMRAAQLEKKRGQRRNIAIGALIMWGVVGAGIGYGWRKLPWDEWEDARS